MYELVCVGFCVLFYALIYYITKANSLKDRNEELRKKNMSREEKDRNIKEENERNMQKLRDEHGL